MANCRYRQGVRCDGPGTLKVSTGEPSDSCLECDGPKDEPKKQKRNEEVKSVALGVKGTSSSGVCDRCHRESQAMRRAKGNDGLYCPSCATSMRKWARMGVDPPEYTGKRGGNHKKPSQTFQEKHRGEKSSKATPSKHQAKIVEQRPAQAVTAVMAGAVIRFTLPIPAGTTALELMDLLRSVPSSAVVG